ncbi:RAB11-binding protein RELCH-like isoform X2 [Macadamia integrifolia]|uniref:RAB11-binding protein RELCH-like isoform X2 n=1 Tax=Macadamia integrifolia TaxID=60698 RepID=UPI001C4E989B|nr:RAB11-binding protein RELCH-like isoform X2 [Macadamia integrifolia]
MDVERSSLCNCVVNFLLEENYLLTAFELLHELLDDGRDVHAIRLKEFFADISQFPPDQISRFNALRVADTQSLLEEKETVEEKLALSEYELRLAQEDILRLKTELRKRTEFYPDDLSGSNIDVSVEDGPTLQQGKRNTSSSDLGPLKDSERKDVNCAIKEYLLLAGYRLTAMTFYEEVTDQDLDVWQNKTACVPDALRHYYYQYLSSTPEAAEEKISLIQENGSLLKTIENLNSEMESLLKNKEVADGQIMALTKSLDALQKDLKDREILVHDLKQSLELRRKELNDCRAEITSLKMHIEGSRSGRRWVSADFEHLASQTVIRSLQLEIENSKAKDFVAENPVKPINSEKEYTQTEEKVIEIHEDKAVLSQPIDLASGMSDVEDGELQQTQTYEENASQPQEISQETLQLSSNGNRTVENNENIQRNNSEVPPDDSGMIIQLNNQMGEPASEKMGLETIQILSDALPKIVPYVLINHREELLPLIMCAIERHPDCSTRDSLTHTLFNVIKRPDEQQRQIIMNACVSLAKNVGEMRTESELLPQCWEQINHMYEERRLLVAQSCGELAEFVRPEIRDSLILSIVQQLVEDSATVVREAAAHNLALLLPLFPNMDKYLKIEELMFQMVCDPSGAVVETSLKKLVPSVIYWGNKLDHILQVLLSHVVGSAQRCPPVSGVEDSVESHLRVLGERERWNVDVLLRMLTEVLPFVHQKAIETCPFPSVMGHFAPSERGDAFFSTSLLELYAGGYVEWPEFDWVHVDCLPVLIQLSCFLPQKEDYLKNRMTKFLLVISESFGDHYLTHIMLPIFFVAVGDTYNLKSLPQAIRSRIKGLRPKTVVAERLAIMCVLPLLLAGILGAPSRHEQLAEYLRKLLVQGIMNEDKPINSNAEIIDAVRFLCTFEEHHGIVFNILWEMVVSANVNMKISAANLLKVLVPYIDAKLASTHVLPALVTLGSDQNLNVKYASIDAFGAVAQHLKSDMIIDKIRVQMDAFLEDGSHEATIAVIHALVVAVPHTTDRLRDYLLCKIFQLSAVAPTGSDMMQRRERANVFCESIRALDATDLPATSVRDFLLPAIQNLFKDPDSLDPAHKEALEIMMRERSGGTFETFSKVMGAHLGIASSVTSFFGEGGLLGKKENGDQPEPVESPKATPITPTEDTRFRRIMRGSFTDIIRGKGKSNEEAPQKQSS